VRQASPGFTLVEVLIALIVLCVGVLALTGSSGLITRMVGRGKVETQAATAASRRMETLRLAAAATTPACTSPEFQSGGPVLEDGLLTSWTVASSGQLRRVRVTVRYVTTRGIRSAELESSIAC
jgi:prepilin-type N-terminal cleavage/methylation domain-containing protein